MTPNPAVDLAPLGRWTLRDEAAPRRAGHSVGAVATQVRHALPCNGFVDRTHNGGRRGRHSSVLSAPLWSTHGRS